LRLDVLIAGGGTGGVAAALALAKSGLTVWLTEETEWLGGQLTAQCVPPDEHPWIEETGRTRSYARYRTLVRQETISQHSLAPADPWFNPGGGWVSRLCHEPLIGRAVIQRMLEGSEVRVFHQTVVSRLGVAGDRITSATLLDRITGQETEVEPTFVLDATELGDLLPLCRAEYRLGAEPRSLTGEPSASEEGDPHDVQGFTWCACVGFDPSGDHTIEKPREYERWKAFAPEHWTGPLLSLTYRNPMTGEAKHLPVFAEDSLSWFGYRQIVGPPHGGESREAVTVLNWPQNDFMVGKVVDEAEETVQQLQESSRQLTLSLVYWLQTEQGLPGIRLRPDIAGTVDGLAAYPYHREGRRIEAVYQVREQDVATHCHPGAALAPHRQDSVGVGAYRIDLHPGANGSPGLDLSSLPFQIPVGMLVHRRLRNLLAAGKCCGTTHITNGCYRLHPVEWNVGEAAGALARHCLARSTEAHSVCERPEDFQTDLRSMGIQLAWPEFGPL